MLDELSREQTIEPCAADLRINVDRRLDDALGSEPWLLQVLQRRDCLFNRWLADSYHSWWMTDRRFVNSSARSSQRLVSLGILQVRRRQRHAIPRLTQEQPAQRWAENISWPTFQAVYRTILYDIPFRPAENRSIVSVSTLQELCWDSRCSCPLRRSFWHTCGENPLENKRCSGSYRQAVGFLDFQMMNKRQMLKPWWATLLLGHLPI